MSELRMTCQCGALKQTLAGPEDPSENVSNVEICHCYGCRHSTGLLYASYYKLSPTSSATLSAKTGTTKYVSRAAPGHIDGSYPAGIGVQGAEKDSSPGAEVTLYFCSTCGCHAFRSVVVSDGVSVFEVASGTLTHGIDAPDTQSQATHAKFGPHVNLESTKDGGVSKWMSDNVISHSHGHADVMQHHAGDGVDRPTASEEGVLAASCLCQHVNFRVTRPNATSLDPKSTFPDLMIPYHTNVPELKNPDDVKWWLRQEQTKYLAGLCACKSCRLTAGFEIQSWAFIPRTNILFETGKGADWGELDFNDLHERGVLRGYESSPGVIREFCPTCGATVFWHDKWRPDLTDVSVGLLHGDGVRAEAWLDWWTGRVSFVEDTELDRHQSPAARAVEFLRGVEDEVQKSGGKATSAAEI